MEENLLSDDFYMLECESQAVDTVPGDTGQTVSSFHNENLLVTNFVTNLIKHC